MFAFILGFFVTTCAVGPDYVKPTQKQLNVPQSWHAVLPHNGSNKQMLAWWGQYDDPVLNFLIESAMETNPSLAEAIAKVRQAQANIQSSRSFFYPTVTANGSAAASYDSTVSLDPSYGSDIFTDNGMTNQLSGGFNASWELDLFGAISRSVEVYQNLYDASKDNWSAAKVSLVAQVADTYVQTRACQSLLTSYKEEKKSRTTTENYTLLRVRAGLAAPIDGKQATGSLQTNNNSLAQQVVSCEKLKNLLTSLTGVKHSILEAKLAESYGYIPIPKITEISKVPADVLSQRPDIASAERNLAAANALIGVATANRYPQVTLSGQIYATDGTLYQGQQNTWSIGPSVSIPITNGGYLKSQVDLNQAKYDEAFAQYRSKVNTAVQDVEDALARIEQANKRVVAADKAKANYEAYFVAFNKKYEAGWATLLNLETIRSSVLTAVVADANARLELNEAWIALYKAVGGGWQESTVIVKKS